MSYIKEMGKKAKAASYVIQSLTSKKKNEILEGVADGLLASKDEIFKANAVDVEKGKKNDLDEALIDRLIINERR
jgi:glutamate-5-semialdehyde dehydrogenase